MVWEFKFDRLISMTSVITTLALLCILETIGNITGGVRGDTTGDIKIQNKDISEDGGKLKILKIELLFPQSLAWLVP